MMWDINIGWWWVFGWSFLLLFWVGIIFLIVWAVKKLGKGGGTTTKSDPLDIAKERYAKGEISKEEFEQLKKDLS